MLGVIFQQAVTASMVFHQAIITELTISRSCLQGWFSTGHDYRYRLPAVYYFMAGLTAGHVCRAGLKI
jgi:hypothetical protein